MFEFLWVFVIAWIVVATVVGAHASDQGKTWLWGPLVFCTGIFGLLAYTLSFQSGGNRKTR